MRSAVDGESTTENLRLRCRAHNQRYARQYFGIFRVDAAVQHDRRRRTAAEGPGLRCGRPLTILSAAMPPGGTPLIDSSTNARATGPSESRDQRQRKQRAKCWAR